MGAIAWIGWIRIWLYDEDDFVDWRRLQRFLGRQVNGQ